MLPLNLYARVRFCCAHLARETVGAACTPVFPAPSYFCGRANVIANLGRNVSRDRESRIFRRWVERSDTHQARRVGRRDEQSPPKKKKKTVLLGWLDHHSLGQLSLNRHLFDGLSAERFGSRWCQAGVAAEPTQAKDDHRTNRTIVGLGCVRGVVVYVLELAHVGRAASVCVEEVEGRALRLGDRGPLGCPEPCAGLRTVPHPCSGRDRPR